MKWLKLNLGITEKVLRFNFSGLKVNHLYDNYTVKRKKLKMGNCHSKTISIN